MNKLNKTIGFLDFMIKAVFISTFVFTAIAILIAYKMFWEQVMVTLVERWFTIMVGELVVMGVIQVVKEIVQGQIRKSEMQFEKELNTDNYNEGV